MVAILDFVEPEIAHSTRRPRKVYMYDLSIKCCGLETLVSRLELHWDSFCRGSALCIESTASKLLSFWRRVTSGERRRNRVVIQDVTELTPERYTSPSVADQSSR